MRSAIEWTDVTWNPVRGCSRISPGCEHCYAERVAVRFCGPGRPYQGFAAREWKPAARRPGWTGKVALVPEKLAEPLRWRKPRRVFVNSMSDLFHESLHDGAIDQVFGVMVMAEAHTYQILTKRAARMRAYFSAEDVWARIEAQARRAHYRNCLSCQRADDAGTLRPHLNGVTLKDGPYPHVWLGVSAEDQQRADERIPELLQTPAAVRFVSAEPLLGPIDLHFRCAVSPPCAEHQEYHARKLLHWVIVGGESGPGARPCDVAWIRSIAQQCREAGVACFVKQVGANVRDRNDVGFMADIEVYAEGPRAGRPVHPRAWPEPREVEHNPNGYREEEQGAPVRVHIRDSKGGDPSEWPEDLRVREFPA